MSKPEAVLVNGAPVIYMEPTRQLCYRVRLKKDGQIETSRIVAWIQLTLDGVGYLHPMIFDDIRQEVVTVSIYLERYPEYDWVQAPRGPGELVFIPDV